MSEDYNIKFNNYFNDVDKKLLIKTLFEKNKYFDKDLKIYYRQYNDKYDIVLGHCIRFFSKERIKKLLLFW